jgi:hypothetical protein
VGYWFHSLFAVVSVLMYSVVAHNADPYLELDTPADFATHRDALQYAIDIAIVFRAAQGAPSFITISGPDGSHEWSIEALLFTRKVGVA